MRFIPDTLRDALWRPIAMGAPDAGVYMEIMAPDLRFVCLLILTLAAVVFALLRKPQRPAVWALALFVWLTFIPWLATSGNGRYFIAILLIAGPLCVALIHQLPLTRSFRLAAAMLVVALQGFALVQSSPWGAWALAAWSTPYFPVALTKAERETPATYVTIAGISYSLIAPQFDPRSRWIGLASLAGDPEHSPDDRRAQALIAKAVPLGQAIKLVIPTLPQYMDGQSRPDAAIQAQINRMLAPHALALQAGQPCKMIESRGIASQALRHLATTRPETVAKLGFWICPLAYPVPRPAPAPPSPESRLADQVFAQVERSCPRMFHPGEASTVRLVDGFERGYPSSDSKAYVLDTGEVLYKYWRGLNPGHIGTTAEVLAPGFKMDCNTIRGRSGLPWERQL
jgi:hypothetical protein